MRDLVARQRRKHPLLAIAGFASLALSVWLVARAIDPRLVARSFEAAFSSPLAVAAILSIYASAFVVRAWVWCRVLPSLNFGHALAALHVSLGANHVLPFRMGEALRVTSVVRRAEVPLASATASTVMLRAADILAVVGLAAALGPTVASGLSGDWIWLGLIPVGGLCLAGAWWLRRLRVTGRAETRIPVAAVVAAAVVSWVLESAVIWQAARWAGLEITAAEAVLVTAVTIAAQVVAIAPGGLGTYEAAATAAFVAIGAAAAPALGAAFAAHALKTLYALVTGGISLFVPAPSAFGNLRLPRRPSGKPGPASTSPPSDIGEGGVAAKTDPVVLFLPAHNEEAAVASVVRRVPGTVCGHRVVTVVVDDGSTDRTAAEAAAVGADVLRTPENRGLGAAVRAGLRRAGDLGPAAVAFCDADGEYAPEELERLVAPILRGEADYVVGSRFAGDIRRMLPHRRIGNRVLTAVVSFIARRRIGDGQSGYRAFSRAAARDAEVIHDFNYAQVLTLDLVAKGYRYAEVPISYGFRTEGASFIRLIPYLRAVIPAMHRELNA